MRRYISFPPDAIQVTAGGGVTIYRPDPLSAVFTAGMAKRASPGPFATGIIVQGKLDGTGTPDILTFPRGDLLGNQTQLQYANFDPYQFTALKWWTAETASADRAVGYSYVWYASADYYARYDYANSRFEFRAGGVTHTHATAITAGIDYCIAFSADTKKTIDGTNQCRSTVNDTHNFGGSSLVASAPDATIAIGSDGSASPANAIVEGLTVIRRILTDGDGNGTNIGVDDELAEAYNAGSGADITLIVGSFGVTVCVPTDSTAGALTTGTGLAWSHPHASNLVDVWGMWDGGLPGTAYVVEFDGSGTYIDCGSGATLDDIAAGGQITVEGRFRIDGAETTLGGTLVGKGAWNGVGWAFIWQPLAERGLSVIIETSGTSGIAYVSVANADLADGKDHHLAFTYDDTGARTPRVWIDGKEPSYATQTAATGVYSSDAARSVRIGDGSALGRALKGGVAWVRLSDNLRYTANFEAPRDPPGVDGNTVEQWELDEGTGATAVAQVTPPANNGAITSGSWSSIWEVEGTPVVPQSVEFNGTTTSGVVADAAAIQDLHTGAFTVEIWARVNGLASQAVLFEKTDGLQEGWRFYLQEPWNGLYAQILTDGVVAYTYSPTGTVIEENVFHHFSMQYDNGGDRKAYLWIDGVPQVQNQIAGTGNVGTDVGNDLYLGNNLNDTWEFDGGLGGWARLSNILRHANGKAFVPNDRVNPPGLPDANSVWQIDYSEGAGATIADGAVGGNDVTLTDYVWNNTPDMTIDEPGARVFNNGYNVSSDNPDDGITIIETVTAETDYVIRLVLSLGQSGRAWPEIYLYDNTGAVQIGATFSMPRCHDVHTGANNSATLINANGSFTQQLVGWECYNITDGSTGTITAVSGDKTTITVTLAGGTDDDFDTNDEYVIRPPSNGNYCDYPFATETIFVFRTPAACVSMDIKLRNAAGEGICQIHECQVLESLLDGGDMETGAGNPWIPTGWVNSGLDAGDSQASSAGAGIIHGGVDCIEAAVGASNEGIQQTLTLAIGGFYSLGTFYYGDGTVKGQLQSDPGDLVIQSTEATHFIQSAITAVWQHLGAVFRAKAISNLFTDLFRAGAAGVRYMDDSYAIALDDITLTATPASEANSAEGTGRRIDGYDNATTNVPVGQIKASQGDVRFGVEPRHTDTTTVLFGNSAPTILTLFGDANNYVTVLWSAASTIQLAYNANGAGVVSNTWATGGAFFTPGLQYVFRIKWTGLGMQLFVDGTLRITIAAPTGFAWPATTVYWGSTETGVGQVDAVFFLVT